MEIINGPLSDWDKSLPVRRVPADRSALAKRRWRGVAEDGCELGFDLKVPLADGVPVLQRDDAVYVIAQKYEPVLEVTITDDASAAARLGWMIGNLHFPLEVAEGVIRVVDDAALRQMFEREGIAFTACKRVFSPMSGAHHH